MDIPGIFVEGPPGWSRLDFDTSEPDIALIREWSFLEANWIKDKPRRDGGDFKLRLKQMEIWQEYGTIEEVFEGKATLEYDRWSRTPVFPLLLASDDKIIFHMED